MITATNTSTGDTWTYSYNFRGQMTGAVETNSDDTVIAQVTYTYDALGQSHRHGRKWHPDVDAL